VEKAQALYALADGSQQRQPTINYATQDPIIPSFPTMSQQIKHFQPQSCQTFSIQSANNQPLPTQYPSYLHPAPQEIPCRQELPPQQHQNPNSQSNVLTSY